MASARVKRLGLAAAVLACGLFTGTLVISIGVGAAHPSINTVMAPLVCPGDEIVPAWQHHPKGKPFGYGPCVKERWVCVDRASGQYRYAGYRTTFTAGAVYGTLLAFAIGLVLWRRGTFAKLA